MTSMFYTKENKMASKRKSREQKRLKRLRQKKRRAKKKAFLRALIMKKFVRPQPEARDFGDDNFEYLLAEDRHQQKTAVENRRKLLSRKFSI
jgi:hypothetical protein